MRTKKLNAPLLFVCLSSFQVQEKSVMHLFSESLITVSTAEKDQISSSQSSNYSKGKVSEEYLENDGWRVQKSRWIDADPLLIGFAQDAAVSVGWERYLQIMINGLEKKLVFGHFRRAGEPAFY